MSIERKRYLLVGSGILLIIILAFVVTPTSIKIYRENRKEMVETYMTEGGAYSREGSFDKAVNRYKAAVTIDPNHVDARLKLADIYSKKGNYPEAESEFLKVTEIQPQLDLPHFLLADVYSLQGKYDLAITEHKKTLTTSTDPNLIEFTLNNLADVYLKKGLFTEAKSTIDEALRRNPNLGVAYLTLAEIYEKQKMYPEALDALKNLEKPSVELPSHIRKEADKLKAKIEGLMGKNEQ